MVFMMDTLFSVTERGSNFENLLAVYWCRHKSATKQRHTSL